jgi:hypothetical protein
MFEFAQAERLWLLGLLGVFLLAWVLARRYQRRRVTYDAVWRRVAQRMTPPGWRRILRTVLTLAIALSALAGIALFAAGLQRPVDEVPPPLVCFIVLDNGVAMRAGSPSLAEAGRRRAAEVLQSLQPDDRAVVAWFHDGQPVLSQWLEPGDAPPAVPPTDFAPPDLEALLGQIGRLGVAPGMREDAQPFVLWLGVTPLDLPALDAPERLAGLGPALGLGDVPLFADSLGGALENNFLTRAEVLPAEAPDTHSGVLEVEAHRGTPQVRVFEGERLLLDVQANRVELPLSSQELRVHVRVPGRDALPDDDWLEFRLPGAGLNDVVLVYPEADGGPNVLLLELLRSLLPGRDIRTVSTPEEAVEADLLVADRVLPENHTARALLCFGVIPPGQGRVGEPVRADPNLRAPAPAFRGDWNVPDLTTISAGEALPLHDHPGLHPLSRHLEGGTLVAVGPGVLYSGFIPHKSTLLEDASGLLLLMRWVESLQRAEVPVAPLLARAGSELELEVPGPARLELEPVRWDDSRRPPGFDLLPGPDGRVTFTLPDVPGRWRIVARGETLGVTEALWARPELQDPGTPASRISLHGLRPPERVPDWRDLLPGLLLWLALGLITLEWLLWLAGITD